MLRFCPASPHHLAIASPVGVENHFHRAPTDNHGIRRCLADANANRNHNRRPAATNAAVMSTTAAVDHRTNTTTHVTTVEEVTDLTDLTIPPESPTTVVDLPHEINHSGEVQVSTHNGETTNRFTTVKTLALNITDWVSLDCFGEW